MTAEHILLIIIGVILVIEGILIFVTRKNMSFNESDLVMQAIEAAMQESRDGNAKSIQLDIGQGNCFLIIQDDKSYNWRRWKSNGKVSYSDFYKKDTEETDAAQQSPTDETD